MTTSEAMSFSIGSLNWKSVTALAVFVVAVLLFTVFKLDGKTTIAALVVATGIFSLILFQLNAARVTVSSDRLVVGGGIYKVKIPWDEIDTDHATALEPKNSFRLGWRKNGIGWPGCNLGWFSSNGKKGVFAATSGRNNLIYIPTRKNFDIVVTPDNPDEFMQLLKQH